MLENAQDSSPSVSLPYDAFITRIFLHSMIDLSSFPVVDFTGPYDTQVFKSMGYVLVDFQWCKKDSSKARSVKVNSGKSLADSATILIQEVKGMQEWLLTLEEGGESTSKRNAQLEGEYRASQLRNSKQGS